MDGYARTNRNLKRVVLALLIAVLVTVLILSSVFAKYTAGEGKTVKTRPAVFSIVLTGDEPKIHVNSSPDGNPGVTLGRTVYREEYNFTVMQLNDNEVLSEYNLMLEFNPKIGERLLEENVFNNVDQFFGDGIFFSFSIYHVKTSADQKEELINITQLDESSLTRNSDGSVVWSYKENIDANKIPFEDTYFDSWYEEGEERPQNNDYRIILTIYNNTMMDGSNSDETVYLTNGIKITASAKQLLELS